MVFCSSKRIFTFFLGVILLGTLSGCPKFGNRVVEGGPPDGWSGQYSVPSPSFERCAVLTTQPGAQCAPESPSLIPSDLQAIFASPTTLQLLRPGAGEAYFISTNDHQKGYPTLLDLSNGEITHHLPVSDLSPLWTLGECLWRSDTYQSGLVTKNATTGILGKIELDFVFQFSFEGRECDAVLTQMSQCMQTIEQCEPSDATNTRDVLQAYARSWFNAYIQSGILTYQDITHLEALGTLITYR